MATVELAHRGDLLVLLGDIELDGVVAGLVIRIEVHLTAEIEPHDNDGGNEDKASEGVPEARGGSAAEDGGEPVEMGRVEGECGRKQVEIGDGGEPVSEARSGDVPWSCRPSDMPSASSS